jgi:hypothetical protein
LRCVIATLIDAFQRLNWGFLGQWIFWYMSDIRIPNLSYRNWKWLLKTGSRHISVIATLIDAVPKTELGYERLGILMSQFSLWNGIDKCSDHRYISTFGFGGHFEFSDIGGSCTEARCITVSLLYHKSFTLCWNFANLICTERYIFCIYSRPCFPPFWKYCEINMYIEISSY